MLSYTTLDLEAILNWIDDIVFTILVKGLSVSKQNKTRQKLGENYEIYKKYLFILHQMLNINNFGISYIELLKIQKISLDT